MRISVRPLFSCCLIQSSPRMELLSLNQMPPIFWDKAKWLFTGEKPHFAEVLAIAVSGREMLVQAAASSRVEAVVAAAERWQENCRQTLAKKTSGNSRVSKCIRIVSSTISNALQQLQLRITVSHQNQDSWPSRSTY